MPSITARPTESPIFFEYTNDPQLLNEYYNIREACYKKDLNLKNFSGKETEYDKKGHILIAKKGNSVIGGVRLFITSNIPNSDLLPLESKTFRINSIIKNKILAGKKYGEFGRFIVLAKYRKQEIVNQFFIEVTNKCLSLDTRHIFFISPLNQSRFYKKKFQPLGWQVTVHKEIEIPYTPIYEHLNPNIFLTSMEMTNSNTFNQQGALK